MLTLTLSGTWLCSNFRSLPLLPVALFCGTWPFPFRCRVRGSTLSVRWLFVEHLVPLDKVTGCTLVARPNHLLPGRSQQLEVSVAEGHTLLLAGPVATLRALRSDLTRAVSAPRRGDPASNNGRAGAIGESE